MMLLQERLEEAGFATVSHGYVAAFDGDISDLAEELREVVLEEVRTPCYHFVAHSLGNVIVRQGFEEGWPEGLGRIVMLAPPNQPPKLARWVKDNPIFKLWSGEAGQRIADPGYYRQLPVPEVEFGVIAGDRGQSLTFDEPNDGILAVDSTRLAGMADFLVLPRSHTFLMNGRDTAEAVVRFLRTGRFH
jgi:triacylglycerol lipase